MLAFIARYVVAALAMLVVSWVVPGFVLNGFTGALVAALVIALLLHGAESVMGGRNSNVHRGVVGFLVSAAVIYLSQYIVPGAMSASILGALLAALAIGLVDMVLPTPLRLQGR